MRQQTGLTLVESLVAVTVAAVGLLVVLPAATTLGTGARCAAGARVMAQSFHGLRFRSVAEGRAYGLLFDRDEQGWFWLEGRDGDGDGVSRTDIDEGIDTLLSRPRRLEELVPHVTLGFPAGTVPLIPPGRGLLDTANPLRFGASRIIAFSPLGTSSNGTLYVSDQRRELYAVRLYGRTARVRVLRYDFARRRWTR